MENDRFNNYLHREAEKFSMEPSPAVLQHVMDALRKKKKRRIFFWLWILPGFGAGILLWAASYFTPFRQPGSTKGMRLYTLEHHRQKTATLLPDDPLLSRQVPPVTHSQNTGNTEIKKQQQPHQQDAEKNSFSQNTQTSPGTGKITKTTTSTTTASTTATTPTTGFRQNNQSEESTLFHSGHENNAQTEPVALLTPYHTVPLPPAYTGIKRPGYECLTVKMTDAPQPFRHFAVGLWFSPGVNASLYYSSNGTDSAYTASRKKNDVFRFGFSAGATFWYSPLKWLALETGIGYTHITSMEQILDNSASAMDAEIFPQQVDFSSFVSSGGVPKTHPNQYGFLTIPVAVYFQKRWKHLGVEGGIGIDMNIPVYMNAYEHNGSSGTLELKNSVSGSRLNKCILGLNVNANLVFHTGRYSVFAGPVFQYQVTPLYSGYITRQHPYFIGAKTGFRVSF